jgi:hypothetical protein
VVVVSVAASRTNTSVHTVLYILVTQRLGVQCCRRALLEEESSSEEGSDWESASGDELPVRASGAVTGGGGGGGGGREFEGFSFYDSTSDTKPQVSGGKEPTKAPMAAECVILLNDSFTDQPAPSRLYCSSLFQ